MQYHEILDTLQNLTHYKPKQREIAEILNLRVNVIGQRSSRGSSFSVDEIKKIGDFYGVDLLHKKKLDDIVNSLACDYSKSKSDQLRSGSFAKVIYRPDVYLSAGYGVTVYDESAEFMILDERLFFTDRGTRINPAKCEIVTVSGNSMAPEYRHGDRVILDKSVTSFIDGHIFAFKLNGECFIKEINLAGKKVKCISLNPEYEPFWIETDDVIEIFGRIVPRVRL